MRHTERKWQLLPTVFALVLVCCGDSAKIANDHNYHLGDSAVSRSIGTKHKRFGWLKVRPLWMDIEKSCFDRTCVAPYAVQLISMEANINHTAMFNMDIHDPAPPVDMYFPTPPSKGPNTNSDEEDEDASATANFSVGLFGVDPTYRFPRHCHPMIENKVTFFFPNARSKRFLPPPSIISFGAECLNLTFQITVIPAISDLSPGREGSVMGGESSSLNIRGVSSADGSFTIRTPVPMWILAVSAGLNAALLFALVALLCHVALAVKKRRNKRLRRQRSSAASSAATTTSTYVPACSAPMTRRATPPLPPPPLRPPPSRAVCNEEELEARYDVPWSENKFVNGANEYKITFNTLPHKQKEAQYFSYYYSPNEHMQSPVIASGEINCNDRPKPLRRTNTPSSVAI